MNKKIRMVGLDLDGTLLNEKKQLTAHTKEVLEEAIREGVVVLPATGRPLNGILPEVRAIKGLKYALTANGAAVVDLNTGERLVNAAIPWERSIDVIDRLVELGHVNWEVYCDGKCFVDTPYYLILHDDLNQEFRDYLMKSRIREDGLYDRILRAHMDIDKIHIMFSDTGRRNEVLALLQEEFPDLVVTFATTFNVEIFSKAAGKGNALLALGEKLGISKEEIMGCGDSHNDWDMLKKVGFPVVMANGDDETKALAAYITKSNEEDGVAYALEQFVLQRSGTPEDREA